MSKSAVLARLRAEIARVEGNEARLEATTRAEDLWRFGGPGLDARLSSGLSLAGIHELSPDIPAHWPSVVAMTLRLMLRLPPTRTQRPLLWVQNRARAQERGRMSATHLVAAGLALERLVLLDVDKDAEALWALEEALHTPTLAAVIACGLDISFTASRRLALACGQTLVPLLHLTERPAAQSAALTRWQVAPLPSAPEPLLIRMVGSPRWRLTLLRARMDMGCLWPVDFNVEWNNRALCLDMVDPVAARPVATQPAGFAAGAKAA
jgi:protein ImuA